jgi:hypothetical protein
LICLKGEPTLERYFAEPSFAIILISILFLLSFYSLLYSIFVFNDNAVSFSLISEEAKPTTPKRETNDSKTITPISSPNGKD